MYKLTKNDHLVIYLDRPLSTFNQNFISKCFQPILDPFTYSFYLALYSLVNPGLLESKDMTISSLMKKINTKDIDQILNARIELEAFGLIKTYLKTGDDNYYIIVINNLPTPYEFFSNMLYTDLLKAKLESDDFDNLIKEYIVHKEDLNSFMDITSPIDEVFTTSSTYQSLWQDNKVKINVNNNHFDYEYVVLVLSSTNIDEEQLKSVEFYNQLNRLAWMFDLKDDELITAVKYSIKDGKVDYDVLRTECKKQYKTEIKLVKLNIEKENSSVLINTLNNTRPLDIVQNKYHTNLTSSEIEMFDRLLVDTNISLGVLNVLIIYVLDNKNGEIPAYNYFLKIINTWIRKGITTTEKALSEVTTPKGSQKAKPVADWYNEYVEEVNKQKQEEKEIELASIEELEEFFKK